MSNNFASKVADHYNKVEQRPVRERSKSEIITLRKFNNAMKSLMHKQVFKYANLRFPTVTSFSVLDLGCGKGGDIPKYEKNYKVGFVVGADIADVSIQQAEERYRKLIKPRFKANFVVADLTRANLPEELVRKRIIDPEDKFHIASSQFSIHYSFESFEQAYRYIANASHLLTPLGLFIGTYPDGPKLLRLARESETPGTYEVDDVLSVKFDKHSLDNPKPFGTKYHFKLKEVVDCPEFLVHPKVLESVMNELGFKLLFDRSFEENLNDALNGVDRIEVKKIFEYHRALDINFEEAKARLDEAMWKTSSIYRCFCYTKL